MEPLAKVIDVFTITGRGVVVAIEFVSQTGKVKIGDKARLRNSDGTTIETHIRGVEFLCNPGGHYHPRTPCQTGIMLDAEIGKDRIQLGAEIYVYPEEQTLCKNG